MPVILTVVAVIRAVEAMLGMKVLNYILFYPIFRFDRASDLNSAYFRKATSSKQ